MQPSTFKIHLRNVTHSLIGIRKSSLMLPVFVLAMAGSVRAADSNQTWTTTTGVWDTGVTANWTPGSTWTAGNDAIFANTSGTVTITPAGVSAFSLQIGTTGSVNLTLNGGPLTLTSVGTGNGFTPTAGTSSAIVVNNGGSTTIYSEVILGAAATSTQTFTLTGGPLNIDGLLTDNGVGVNLAVTTLSTSRMAQFNGGISLAGATGMTINGGGGTNAGYFFGGNIAMSGGGSLILQDSGSASLGALYVLGGTDTFTGGGVINLKNGVLAVSNSASLPNIFFDGGTSGSNAGALLVTGSNFTNFSSTTVTFASNSDVQIGVAAGSAFNVNVVLTGGTGLNGDFNKFDAGNLTISGNNNTYNRFTELNGGQVTLDYSTNNNNKISSGNQLFLGGTSLVLNGGSFAQTVGNTVLRVTTQNSSSATMGGASTITQQGGTSTIALKALTQTIGNTLDVVSGASTTTANTNGILAPWATFGSGTSMLYASGGGTITGVAVSGTALPGSGGTATSNYSMTSGTTTVSTSESAYTLQYTGTSGGGIISINSGQALTLNGLLNTGTDGLTISGSGTLTIGAAAAPASNELVFQGPGNTTISSVISGGGSLTDSDTGTLSLTGANTYTGNNYFNAGVVAINSNASLGAPATGASVYLDGGALQEVSGTGALTLDNAGSNKRNIVLGPNGGTISVLSTDVLTVDGVVSSYLTNLSGGLTKVGPGTLVLSGADTFTGGLNINGGTVQLGNGSALGGGNAILNAVAFGASSNGTLNLNGNSITIVGLTGDSTAHVNNGASNATLTANVVGNLTSNTFGGVLANGSANALSLAKDGAGSLVLAGANTYTGATTILDGTLQLGSGGTTGSLATGSAITDNGTFAVNRSNAVTEGTDFAATISGTGGFTQAGSGTTTLIGTNTYSGPTTISAGTLALGTTTALPTLAFTGGSNLVINGTLDLVGNSITLTGTPNGTGTITSSALTPTLTLNTGGTYSGNLTGSLAVTKTGTGTLVLNGTTQSTYTGATTISGGGLTLNESNIAGNANLISGTSTALTLGTGTLTISGPASGTGSQTFSSIALAASSSGTIVLNDPTGAANLTSTAAMTRGTGSTLFLDLSNAGTGVFLTNLTASQIESWSIVKDATGTGIGTTNASKDLVRLASTVLTATNPTSTATNFTTSGTVVDTQSPISLNTLFIDTTSTAGGWDLGTHTATFGNGTIAVNGSNNYSISDGSITNSPLVINNAGTGTLSLGATVTGSSSLATTGNVIVSGANTFTGGTTINGGTFKAGVSTVQGTSGAVGNGNQAVTINGGTLDLNGFNVGVGALNTSAGTTVLNNGASAGTNTLTVGNNNTSMTISGVIQDHSGSNTGVVALVKTGSGTLNFSGTSASTYSGGTTLSGGNTIMTNGSAGTTAFGTGPITFNGGELTMFSAGIINRTYAQNFVINNIAGNEYIDGSNQGGATFNGSFTGAGSLAITDEFGNQTLNFAGNMTGFTGTLDTSTDGAGTSNHFLTLSNSTNVGIAGAKLILAGGGSGGTGVVTFQWGGTGSQTIGIGELTSSGGVGSATDKTTLGVLSDSVAATTATWSVGALNTSDIFAGKIVNGAGTSALTKVGSGTLTLTNASDSYSGATAVNGGTLALASGAALSSTSGVTVAASTFLTEDSASSIGSSGALNVSGTATLAGTNSSFTSTTINSGGTVTQGDGTNNGSLAGTITDNGLFVVNGGATAESIANSFIGSGTGSVTLASAAGTNVNTFGATVNSYSGGTTVTSGTWSAGLDGAFGTGNLVIAPSGSNAVVVNTAAATQTLASTANVTVNNGGGSGTLNFNDFAPVIASLSGNGSVVLNNQNGQVLTVGNNTTDSVFSGVISENSGGLGGAIVKTGTDKLTLSGSNTYTDNSQATTASATEVQAGILNIQNNSALGSGGAALVDSGATLQLQGGITETGNALTVSGTGATNATGALENVSGSNSYGGGVTLAGATTIASDAGNLDIPRAGGAITTTAGSANLTLTGAGNGSIEAAINTGGSTLTKSGAGTWTLAGANGFTGATTISGGTLNVTGSISGSAVSVSSGATLSGTGSTGFATISGGGSIGLQNGSVGTLTVSGLSTGQAGTASSLTFDIGSSAGSIDTIADNGTLTLNGVGGTTITIGNATGVSTLASGLYNLVTYTGAYTGSLSDLTLSTTTLDGQTLSLVQGVNSIELQVGSSTLASAYFNGQGNNLNTAANYDPSATAGASTGGTVGTASNVFFAANRNGSTTPNISAPLEVNSVNFGAGTAGVQSGITVSSTNTSDTLTVDATGANGNTAGSGITVASGSDTISAPVVLGGSQSWTTTGSTTSLNVSGQVSGAYALTKAGTGGVTLSNPTGNIYTGGTTVNAGTLYVTNTSNSGTGTGAVTVNSGGTLAGNGFISTSAGVTVNGGGSLISGSRSQISGTGLASLGGMSLVNTALTVGSSVGTANLTFDLAAGNSGIGGGSAGFHTFANPNNNTTYLSLNGSSSINFAGATSISLVDLTNTNGHNGSLALLTGTPYLLIHAASNSEYLNLVINSGTDANPILSLSQNDTNATNGYVLGVWAGGSNPLSDYTAISIAQYGADGVTPLVAGPGGTYPAPALYLDAGNLEVVPEPGTWALMIGGLALLVVIQRRRNKVG